MAWLFGGVVMITASLLFVQLFSGGCEGIARGHVKSRYGDKVQDWHFKSVDTNIMHAYMWAGLLVAWAVYVNIPREQGIFVALAAAVAVLTATYVASYHHVGSLAFKNALAEDLEQDEKLRIAQRKIQILEDSDRVYREQVRLNEEYGRKEFDGLREKIGETDRKVLSHFSVYEAKSKEQNEEIEKAACTVAFDIHAEVSTNSLGRSSVVVSWEPKNRESQSEKGGSDLASGLDMHIIRTGPGLETNENAVRTRPDAVRIAAIESLSAGSYTDRTVKAGEVYRYYITGRFHIPQWKPEGKLESMRFHSKEEMQSFLESKYVDKSRMDDIVSNMNDDKTDKVEEAKKRLVADANHMFDLRRRMEFDSVEATQKECSIPLVGAEVYVEDEDEAIAGRRKRVARVLTQREIEEEEAELGIAAEGEHSGPSDLDALFERRSVALKKRMENEKKLAAIETKMEEEGWPEEDREIMREEMATLLSK